MAVFKPRQQFNILPGGLGDDSGSDEEFDMPGFTSLIKENRSKTALLIPSQVQNGSIGSGGGGWGPDEDWEDGSKKFKSVPDERLCPEDIRVACFQGNLELIQRALEKKKINIDVYFANDLTPLGTAAAHAQLEVVAFLISNNANINLANYKHQLSPLHQAVTGYSRDGEEKVLQCVKLLVEAGASLTATDKYGVTPLGMAVKCKKIEVVKYLLEKKSDPNIVDVEGRACLNYAAALGAGKLCRMLIENGADVQLVDDHGHTCVEISRDKGFEKLSELLYKVQFTKWKPGLNPKLMDEIDENYEKNVLSRVGRGEAAHGVSVKEDDNIQMLLTAINAEKYHEKFLKHRISYVQLLQFEEEQLKEIGIEELGIRKKIMENIRSVHNIEFQESSIRLVAQNKKITSAEAVCMVNNIKTHLTYISASLKTLRNRIRKDPQSLQYGKERNKIADLIGLCEQTEKNNETLEKDVISLLRLLKSIQNNAELKLGDEILAADYVEENFMTRWEKRQKERSSSGFGSTIKLIIGLGLASLGIYGALNLDKFKLRLNR